MTTQEKTYVTASELAETLDISMGKSYKIIRQLNSELAKEGFITVAGKCPHPLSTNYFCIKLTTLANDS